jgi:hypothetical protein
MMVDADNAVRELSELNTYTVDFQMCWPPDLKAPTELTLEPPPSAVDTQPRPLLWGTDVVFRPEYLHFTSPTQNVTLSEDHALFSFTYQEINNGTTGADAWTSCWLWDGEVVLNVTRGPLGALLVLVSLAPFFANGGIS